MSRVAFVGLGTMGSPMAGHLVAAGHEVVACDLVPARAAALGTASAATPAEAARDADVVILSLPSPPAVEAAVTGPDGVAGAAEPGSVVVDMSTSPPVLARRLAAALAERGVAFLDAPVSGGPAGAEAATLAIMVGGEREAFDRVRPILGALGRPDHVGDHGAGQALKLANNLIVGCTMAAISEACALLEREGIDTSQAYDVLTRSTSDSAVMRRRFPVPGARPEHPASNAYAPLFRLDLLRKDLALALELAAEDGVDTPMTQMAATLYDAALAAGFGELDYSALHRARR